MNFILPENIRCVEVSPGNEESLELFARFYNDVYVRAFTHADECVRCDDFLSTIAEYRTDDMYVRVLLFCSGDEIAGGIVYDYFGDIKTLAIEFIVVAEEYRGKGLATAMLEFTKERICNSRNKVVEWLIIEIEDPAHIKSDDFSYLYFWKKYGMKKIDFSYIQPAISKVQNPVETLMLCARHMDDDREAIATAHVAKFLYLYAHHAFGMLSPENNCSVKKMLDELERKRADTLSLKGLV
ncbi:MAG: GNAT family N-acetyltransferase [Defluviitaleaceae bacterium]|nr:GNAT family N-acetyltransferase [Defluviitaleaceae bacterium]